MNLLRRKMIRDLLVLFTLPGVRAEIARLARLFLQETTRYTGGIKGEAKETREAFQILTKYMKREKVSRAEKKQFVKQMIDLLRGTGVVVPVMLIPIPFVGTVLLIIVEHLLLSMNIQLLPSAFYQQPVKELLTPESIEQELEGAEAPDKSGSMTLFLLIMVLSSLSAVFATAQGTWERVDVPTSRKLSSVCFVDSLYGWAAGDSGTIIHTTDGGSSWILQESPAENDIATVFFLNRLQGWASAFNFTEPPYGTILLKTTDGGNTWTFSPYPQENIFITCIHYFDSLTGWMGGKPHALVKTTDGGISWTQAAIDTSTLAFFPVLKLAFLNQEIGFACGGMFDIAGVIWRTDNGGDLWYAINPSQAPADEVHSIHIFDPQHVMGSGGDPDYGYGVGMIRSSDGGLNWDYDEIGVQGIAFDLDFRTSSQAWSPLGPLCKLIFSSDSGNTWTEYSTPDSAAIYDMTFADSLHGCAVGDAGAVLRFRPPVMPGIDPLSKLVDGKNTIQLFPNPTHGNTTYEILNSASGEVVVEIKSLSGSSVALLSLGFLEPGIHSFSYNTGLLPDGIYLVQVKINGVGMETKKLVVCPW